jgi:hypothetical protein
MRRYHVVTLFPSLLLLKENLKLKSKTISVAKFSLHHSVILKVSEMVAPCWGAGSSRLL